MKVELIYDAGCPNVAEARRNLLQAFAMLGGVTKWTEWERSAPSSPAYASRFGSPTVLVDGNDVAGVEAYSTASHCRLYGIGEQGSAHAPSVELILARLTEATRQKVDAGSKGKWRQSLVVAPGVALGLLPVGLCPACWPAYAGVLSTIGLGFLLSSRYLFPLTALFLAFGVFALAFRARSRRGYGPFVCGTGGALLLLGAKFLLDFTLLAAVGIGLLVAASFWNSWPSRTARPCPKCTPSDAD